MNDRNENIATRIPTNLPEGFEYTGQSFADLKIYKKDNELILYDLVKDRIYHRFETTPIQSNYKL